MNAVETLSYLSSMYGRATALTGDDKLFIEQLYTQIMQKPFVKRVGCADCYKDALIELQIKIKTSGMEKQQYQLRNGALIYDHKTGQYYTNANLTDKVAKEYLKQHPDEVKFFAVIPDEVEADEPSEDEPTPDEVEADEPKATRKPRIKK